MDGQAGSTYAAAGSGGPGPALRVALMPSAAPSPRAQASATSSNGAAPHGAAATAAVGQPSPSLAIMMPDPVHPVIWIVGGVFLAIMAFCCWRAWAATPVRDETNGESARRLRIFSVILIFITAAGALGRAFIVPSGARQTYIPTLDLTTIAWVLLAIFAALLPAITEITVGSVSLRLRRQEAFDIASAVILKLQKLLSDWCISLNEFTAEPKDVGERWFARLTQFVRARLSEASDFFKDSAAPEADTAPRLTVWLANPEEHKLGFVWSNHNVADTPLADKTFAFGEGIAGAAYSEHKVRNEVDPRSVPMFKDFPDVPYTFNSMLVVPIDYGSRRLGVLCVDRMLAEPFDEGAISTTLALAAILGAAIGVANESPHEVEDEGLGDD